MREAILEGRGLCVQFNGIRPANNANFSILKGERLAVIGPNGAGKTTLLNICTGYVRLQSGDLLLDGEIVTGIKPRELARRGVARAFQIPQLFLDETVLTNIIMAIAGRESNWSIHKPLFSRLRMDEAYGILELLGLADSASIKCEALAEGKRKIVDIGMALALKPRLLLLDEPTSGVSIVERSEIMDSIMRALDEQEITTLFIEHDMEVVKSYATRVLVWNDGHVMVQGCPEEVFADRRVLREVVGL